MRGRLAILTLQRAMFGLSCLLLVGSLWLIASVGLNLGIDLRGGSTLRVESRAPFVMADVQDALAGLDQDLGFDLGPLRLTQSVNALPAVSVVRGREGHDGHVLSIAFAAQEGYEVIGYEAVAQILDSLRALDASARIVGLDSVGPKLSGELIARSLLALGLAVVTIFCYIWARFRWQFALGAVMALAYDVIMILGVFAVLQLRFDLVVVAAMLAALGYSLNDTVIIFDRLREKMKAAPDCDLAVLMPPTLREAQGRMLMTGGVALVALLALLLIGGESMRGFALAMLLGVLIGTWSSVFVAAKWVLLLTPSRPVALKPSAATGQAASPEHMERNDAAV